VVLILLTWNSSFLHVFVILLAIHIGFFFNLDFYSHEASLLLIGHSFISHSLFMVYLDAAKHHFWQRCSLRPLKTGVEWTLEGNRLIL